MTTQANPSVLDRDLARAFLDADRAAVRPLLLELVNDATHVWLRCSDSADARDYVHIAPLLLYRQLFELVDGIQVLLDESCALAAEPLLRSAFETSLSLDFVLEPGSPHQDQRSISWLVAYTKNRIRLRKAHSTSTQQGADFVKKWEADFGTFPFEAKEIDSRTDALEQLLSAPELLAASGEYDRIKAAKKRWPNWFSLFGGPINRRELANLVGSAAEPWERSAGGVVLQIERGSLP